MPFKSLAQEKYLYSQHPAVAHEFAAATSPQIQAKLPTYASGQKSEPAEGVRSDMALPDRKIEAMKMLIQQQAQQAKPAGQINYGVGQ